LNLVARTVADRLSVSGASADHYDRWQRRHHNPGARARRPGRRAADDHATGHVRMAARQGAHQDSRPASCAPGLVG